MPKFQPEFSMSDIASMPSARIGRIVPGKLVYIEPTSKEIFEPDKPGVPVAIKPDHVLVKRRREVTPYRGEPFAEVGLREGAEVRIVGKFDPYGANTVIVDAHSDLGLIGRVTNFFNQR